MAKKFFECEAFAFVFASGNIQQTGYLCLELYVLDTAHLLDETVKLLLNVRAAKICGPGVADGELVELQHVHDSHLSHSAAKELRTLVHAGR